MANTTQWVTKLKDAVKESSLGSTLSLILVGFEKILDIYFECPCSGRRCNVTISLAVFIIPAVTALLAMLVIERCPCTKRSSSRNNKNTSFFRFVSIITPPMVWLIQVFINGEYYDCFVTDWKGLYLEVEGDSAHKWCKPLDNADEIQLLLRSKENIVISQSTGFALLVVSCFILGGLAYQTQYRNQSNSENGDAETNEHLIGADENIHNDEEVTDAECKNL